MLKRVRLHLVSDKCAVVSGSEAETAETEHTELTVDARLHDDGTRVELSYRETALTGMEGTTTVIAFQKNDPKAVTLLRHGTVRVAMVFEKGRRHLSVYETPYGPLEVGIFTEKAENHLLDASATLLLEYTVEWFGGAPERTRLSLSLSPYFEKPLPK